MAMTRHRDIPAAWLRSTCARRRAGTFEPVARYDLTARIAKEHIVMDKDRIEGSAKQVKGAVKEAVGKVTGDAKTEAAGKADKAEGKVQNAIGGAKDAVRDALKQ
jgi:uncharacterized protein YjbJ (UPF0337 family)